MSNVIFEIDGKKVDTSYFVKDNEHALIIAKELCIKEQKPIRYIMDGSDFKITVTLNN